MSRKAEEDGLHPWAQNPFLRDPNEAPGAWVCFGPTLDVVGCCGHLGGKNQRMGEPSIFSSSSLCNIVFKIDKNKEKLLEKRLTRRKGSERTAGKRHEFPQIQDICQLVYSIYGRRKARAT